MLGHSIETNLKYYSFAKKNYLEDVRNRLNTWFVDADRSRDLSGTYKIVPFSTIKESPEPLKNQRFQALTNHADGGT